MKNLFKIINRIWQIVLFLLIIVFSLYFLVSALMVMTTKGFAFTDWLISVLKHYHWQLAFIFCTFYISCIPTL